MIHQRYRQTDRHTDGQMTCDSKTALCTTVHRTVKTIYQVASTQNIRYNFVGIYYHSVINSLMMTYKCAIEFLMITIYEAPWYGTILSTQHSIQF